MINVFARLTMLLLKTEKEIHSTLFLANKCNCVLFTVYRESLFIFYTYNREMLVDAKLKVE